MQLTPRLFSVVVVVGLFGCSSSSTDAPPVDTGVDGAASGSGDLRCTGSKIDVCFSPPAPPTQPFEVAQNVELDTDASPLCVPGITDLCVVVGTSVKINSGGRLHAYGKRPLVIVSLGDVEIDGTIDVSSQLGSPAGAGANPDACRVAPSVSTGGAAGSFGGQGGAGGGSATTVGSSPAMPAVTLPQSQLRGGCQGQDGAPVGGKAGGAAGAGGGAVAIIANAGKITVNGMVDASGAGGTGGVAQTPPGNAGGGGSGGAIVLVAPSIVLTLRAQVWANGGSGGQGANTILSGSNGVSSSAPAQGAVTFSAAAGENGGAGAVGTTLTGGDAAGSGSGGAGGGGAGLIIFFGNVTSTAPDGAISPPAQ